MRKAVPPNGIDANCTQLVQADKWGPQALSLQAMYKAIQIEGTFELLNTQNIQAQWFKATHRLYAKTSGHKENHLHKPILRKIEEVKYIHRNTIMTAIENAYAMVEWRLNYPDRAEDSKQIAG